MKATGKSKSGEKGNYMSKPIVNPIDIIVTPDMEPQSIVVKAIPEVDESVFILEALMSAGECDAFAENLLHVEWQPVSITGMSGNYTPGDYIGSWRASSFQYDMAKVLHERILSCLPKEKDCHELTQTDWDGTEQWVSESVNPLFRFIRYKEGGYLLPHYDAPYEESTNMRSLTSLVICLTDMTEEDIGGETMFLKDPQKEIRPENRNLADRTEVSTPDEQLTAVKLRKGDALLFDHRILHEGILYKGLNDKKIIRTDIMFSR